MYSPALGRFLRTDPVGYADGFNLYANVGNDPINGSDPSGTTCAKETRPTGETEERCVADHGRDEWTEDQVDEFDKDYTEAVARVDAAAKDGTTYTLEFDGEQMEMDAKALATRLREMVVTLTKTSHLLMEKLPFGGCWAKHSTETRSRSTARRETCGRTR